MRPRLDGEEGVGLVLVLLVMLALSAMTATALTAAQVTQRQSRNDQDAQAALAATEAGIDDYLYRLGRDDTYWRFRTDGAGGAVRDPDNPAMAPTSSTDREAGWAQVSGSVNEGRYRYDLVDNSVAQDGTVVLQSTGRVRAQMRTVEVTIRKRTVLDYLYFTDYETLDPLVRTDRLYFNDADRPAAAYNPAEYVFEGRRYWYLEGEGTRSWANDNCRQHRYEGRPAQPYCTDIRFITGDVIRGRFHTNDSFLVAGSAQWTREATTSWQDPNGRFWIAHGAASPVFPPGSPSFDEALALPVSNADIVFEVDRQQGGDGCLYSGPTAITLLDNGTMNVTSPATPPYTSSGRVNQNCVGTGVALPSNGVLYVEPATTCVPPGGPSGNALDYPVSGDVTPYGCTAGDAFVGGTYRGQVTVVADNNIVVTGDLRARDRSGTHILGLRANQFVEVYHPVGSDGSNVLGTGDRTIEAAILSNQHSFRVQNHCAGDALGTLNVTGSIAQLFRGPVGCTDGGGTRHGFLKNYNYDDRFGYLSPPYFFDPGDVPWEVRSYAEVPPRF